MPEYLKKISELTKTIKPKRKAKYLSKNINFLSFLEESIKHEISAISGISCHN